MMRHQSTSMWTRSLIIVFLWLTINACGGGNFKGELSPPPLWVTLEASTWLPEERLSLFDRGVAQGYPRINERRARAEAIAVQVLKKRFLERIERLMKTGDSGNVHPATPSEIRQVISLLKALPWAQMCVIDRRFFDAPNNTQYALAKLSIRSFKKTLEREPIEATTKGIVREYTERTFLSLKP